MGKNKIITLKKTLLTAAAIVLFGNCLFALAQLQNLTVAPPTPSNGSDITVSFQVQGSSGTLKFAVGIGQDPVFINNAISYNWLADDTGIYKNQPFYWLAGVSQTATPLFFTDIQGPSTGLAAGSGLGWKNVDVITHIPPEFSGLYYIYVLAKENANLTASCSFAPNQDAVLVRPVNISGTPQYKFDLKLSNSGTLPNKVNMRYTIYNNGEAGAPITLFKFNYWFNENATTFIMQTTNPFYVYLPSGTGLCSNGNTLSDCSVTNLTYIAGCGTQLGNRLFTYTLMNSVMNPSNASQIPPGGGYLNCGSGTSIYFSRSDSANMDYTDDYTRVDNISPAFTDVRQAVLYYNNVLVQEWNNSSTIDPNTGLEPTPCLPTPTPVSLGDLGTAGNYGVLSSTFTCIGGTSAITGDAGYTTVSGLHTVTGTNHIAPTQAGTDQAAALLSLNNMACTYTFPTGAVDLASFAPYGSIGVYTPGVYCSDAAMNIVGNITLNGKGIYIFRSAAALNTTANSIISLTGGAELCDVFWTLGGATTLGATSTFVGTVIDDAGISVGNAVSWTGRALAYGGTVSLDTDTIAVPVCAVAETAIITETSSVTPTDIATVTKTVTPTGTATWTQTAVISSTVTQSVTQTITRTTTQTVTATVTQTVTGTVTKTATRTVTPTVTRTVTGTITQTATKTGTLTITETATGTFTGTYTPSVTNTPTCTETPTATDSVSPSITFTPTITITDTLTCTPTRTQSGTPTFTPTFTETATYTLTATLSGTATATLTNTDTPLPTDTSTITATPSITMTSTITQTFTTTPTPYIDIAIDKNYVKPLEGGTVGIKLKVSAAGAEVTLKVYNLTGEFLREIKYRAAAAGWNEFDWDVKNAAGKIVGQGLYFMHIKSGGNSVVRKVYVLK